jgi:hypothetical protein
MLLGEKKNQISILTSAFGSVDQNDGQQKKFPENVSRILELWQCPLHFNTIFFLQPYRK